MTQCVIALNFNSFKPALVIKNLSFSQQSKVNIPAISSGDLYLFPPCKPCTNLIDWGLSCIQSFFGDCFNINEPLDLGIDDFIDKATKVKTYFTNDPHTKALLEELITLRYSDYLEKGIYYDVPRLRLIPNSNFLKSGISYNYKPHRDTWYGGSQGQINHWIAACNVSSNSTFFIAPIYFNRPILNSSSEFDLDIWDANYRGLASKNVHTESRPHPTPIEDIDKESFVGIDISTGSEICFSGHQLHGSLPNTTDRIRVSIDFRVEIESTHAFTVPQNIDSSATGNYRKYMIPHPKSGYFHR